MGYRNSKMYKLRIRFYSLKDKLKVHENENENKYRPTGGINILLGCSTPSKTPDSCQIAYNDLGSRLGPKCYQKYGSTFCIKLLTRWAPLV